MILSAQPTPSQKCGTGIIQVPYYVTEKFSETAYMTLFMSDYNQMKTLCCQGDLCIHWNDIGSVLYQIHFVKGRRLAHRGLISSTVIT